MIVVNVPFKVENNDILDYIDCYIKHEMLTDLDSEAEEVSVNIIRWNTTDFPDGYAHYDEEKLKQSSGFKELKAQVKKYIYLKRNEPETFNKLYEETDELA